MRKSLLTFLLSAIAAAAVQADEPVRRVQEELRRRNLFFGDVDGKMSPELTGAIRVYQSRKGFEPTGEIDDLTMRSLNIETGQPLSEQASWPDVPVLKSDAARQLPPAQQTALEKAAATNVDAAASPEIPAEGPNGPQNLDPKRVTAFVQNYLRDAETLDVPAQTKYYAYPVDYFNHGPVGAKFVERDTRRYVLRWPLRKYTVTSPIKLAAGSKENETLVEFSIAFRVRNKRHRAEGRTRNFWTIKREGAGLKIVAIKEEHLRE